MSTIQTHILPSACDGLPLSVMTVEPEGKIRGLIQLAHGMAEHKGRYVSFMEFLAEHGYACVINDHRGHGESVKSPDDLGYFYEGGAEALIRDLHQITLWYRSRHPGKPLILFGHSMGSLAVRVYRQRWDGDIDGLVVCGSPGRNPASGFAIGLNRVMSLVRGDRYVSPLFIYMITGRLKKTRTGSKNDWLSTNQDNVRRYDSDPLCGFPFTLNGYRGLLEMMRDAYRPVPAAHPDVPVHFISGENDACAPDRRGFDDAVENLRRAGYRSVTAHMIPGMRHEILNHADHQIVYDELLSYFDRWTAR